MNHLIQFPVGNESVIVNIVDSEGKFKFGLCVASDDERKSGEEFDEVHLSIVISVEHFCR